MTREEAIKELEFRSQITGGTFRKALCMAIKALQEPEIVHCKQCKYRGTSDCAMSYECMCGEQHSWETDIDYCSWGEKAGEHE